MQTSGQTRIDIPDSLRDKLLAFRQRVWTVKLLEAVAGAVVGIMLGYLITFGLDRLLDTPAIVRGVIFAISIGTCALVPWAMHRWVWQRRRLDQLARLLTIEHPSVGDQLLGVIELAENDSEQDRSPRLVAAAMEQVARMADDKDFQTAVPKPRHRRNLACAGLLSLLGVGLLVGTTTAAQNAWARYLSPWSDTQRYTYAAIEPLPETVVVPHGESFTVPITLQQQTAWKPQTGQAQLAGLEPVSVTRNEERYEFELPGQIQPGKLDVQVGDYFGRTTIEPKLRPELVDLKATVQLPAYLERSEPIEMEIRGGAMSAVAGSQAALTATISRPLQAARINQKLTTHQGANIFAAAVNLDQSQELTWEWEDEYGLSGQQPFALNIKAVDDEAPSLICENLPRKKIVLDSEVIPFQIKARDDFGVKRVGMEWKGLNPNMVSPAAGEKILGAGTSTAELLELAATFSAKQLGITAQPIELRVFVEDFLPNRERVYSPACTLFVLNPEQHAVWVTDQLSRWQRMALDVRDRELQLHETNKQLRDLETAQLDDPDTRKRIAQQAAAEQANGRRLGGLVNSGEDLLKQAMRNPEIGVGHLDRWAEMMQLLKDISGNRMPSVADLLKEGSKAEQIAAAAPPSKSGPKAGQNRANVSGGGDPKKPGEPQPPKPVVPTITDIESTRNEMKPGEAKEPGESKPKQPRLTLPTTMLAGNAKSDKQPDSDAKKKVDEAVKEQQDLLAEFEKIANELNEVLANLEGSTLVKRLKAASRNQEQVAQKLGSHVASSFGVENRLDQSTRQSFENLASAQDKYSQVVSYIMDDMSAYFDRSRFMRFKVVLDDMREQNVVGGLRTISEELTEENGLAIAQTEYWSETLDRWAEDLVEVTKCGACPGCKAKGSLPPSIVLEVLQILEGEINLREQTRVAEQARSAVKPDVHAAEAKQLAKSQDEFRDRVDKVILRILELPDAKSDFGKELNMLGQVSAVMTEATDILASQETGSPAIAAETEAIELLLASKRFNPNGGGGGGANPGGGGGGETDQAALALVGAGTNQKEIKEDQGTQQATGQAGTILPEEFRAGLDEYFEKIDR